MKKVILSIFIAFFTMIVTAQGNVANQAASYDAANWKIFLIDAPNQITIGAPPNTAESRSELETITNALKKLDEKKNSSNTILGRRRTCLSLEPGII